MLSAESLTVRRNPCGGGCRMDGLRSGGFGVFGLRRVILVPGLGGGESVPVDLEQVVDGADEPPLT